MKLKATAMLNNRPFRDIVLNHDDLLNHAQEIAKIHTHVGTGKYRRALLARMKENMAFLAGGYAEITDYVDRTKEMVPAAEWFLDNYYLIKDLQREIYRSFPRHYERELPSLASGKYQGYPRVYALMVELVEHTDSQLQGETLKDFVNTYQTLVPFTSGELWAIPIMLRLVILENIRRLVEQILFAQSERETADNWLLPFFKLEHAPEQWDNILESMSVPRLYSSAYAERLLKRLRDFGVDGVPILRWLDKVVAKQDLSIEGLAKLEHQRQAMSQVFMGHAIGSLRFLMEEDWPRFFEEISLVQKILAADPAGIYLEMDFDSRDEYRHQVEKLSRHLGISELVVARTVLARAEQADPAASPELAHVGYYLVGKGRPSLERELEEEWGVMRRLFRHQRHLARRYPALVYFSGIALVLGLLFHVFHLYALREWPLNPGLSLLLFAVLLIPLSSLAVTTVNWVVCRALTPTFFPKLELRNGIPEKMRTMVVIPTLLTNVGRVHDLLEQMEVYYLANQDENLFFALLGDFADAPEENVAGDEEIIRAAKQGIEALNHKYGSKFYFFHRKREWNPAEGVWMGWERKRGKLIEFNRLLRQEGQTSIVVQLGDLSILSGVYYVITLDADTQLPRGSARKLIGTLAHPLHAPRLNQDGTRVVEGYGILQPRVSVSILNAKASFFARTFSGKVGIDPYTTAVSDVYQDLFGEGIFTGKGIYEVEVFHRVTGKAFPDNRILSHDLLEGLYARTGLVTDIELIDGYPAKYHAHMRRLHRWVRGDWQIARWLSADLPLISKWKIFDNLRRSLEAPAQMLLLLLAWTVLPGQPWVWVGIVILDLLWPTVLNSLDHVFRIGERETGFSHDLGEHLVQFGLLLAFLPFQAYTMLDAIIRSLVRQFITHRHLLEWETAAEVERRLAVSVKTSWRLMWPAIGLSLLFFGIIVYVNPARLGQFIPLLLLWLSAPWLSYKISLPLSVPQEQLNWEEEGQLRLWARRIWAFFEDYVNEENNWLPPDNVQIDPPNGVAYRTSPTNIGASLLANLAARDLGYVTVQEMHARVNRTLRTLQSLEMWKGHFYNWYDTRTLQPLRPAYVSTVDSGNLVVYMITLRVGLEEVWNRPLVTSETVRGMYDTLVLLKRAWGEDGSQLERFQTNLVRALDQTPNMQEWYALLETFPDLEEEALPSEEAVYWNQRLRQMISSARQELFDLCPWLSVSAESDSPDAEVWQEMGSATLTELYSVYTQERQGMSAGQQELIKSGLVKLTELRELSQELQSQLHTWAMDTDFRPLFDEQRQLFSIGYRVADGALDKSYYDLLASEARQASFFAIAKGDVPQSHWFRLGRSLNRVKGIKSLVSWSGTMFEFLMPLLVMRSYDGTLLGETYRTVVDVQRYYPSDRQMPWGISESGFYAFDAQLNYQYKAFGVPGLGLKRGLVQDLVISPYSTFLALSVDPRLALENIQKMEKLGFGGLYGLYEAVDYTPERIPVGSGFRLIQSFMAHHQGMSFLALDNVLNNNILQERFHSLAMVQATELLLQERLPALKQPVDQVGERGGHLEPLPNATLEGPRFITVNTPATAIPATHFISNGQYSVMLTNSGSGYSKMGDTAISRWREDVTLDNWGFYIYIQNLNSGALWSAAHQPCHYSGEDYKVTFAPDRVEYYRKDGNISTRTEVVVSSEDEVEIRRISLTNHSQHERTLEITSYFETVLARLIEDLAHPSFGNLFIETEFTHQALLASRRPRREDQGKLWLMHTLTTEGHAVGTLQFESDRSRFIGRGRTLANPLALDPNHPLSNSTGAVLDPIMSLRQRVQLLPGQTARIAFSVGIAGSREDVIRLAEKYRDPTTVSRVFELAWTHSQMELRHLNLSPARANEILSLGGHLLYLSPTRHEQAEILRQNKLGQSGLWPYAISGDFPIILLRVQDFQHLELVRQMILAHEYWKLKGLQIDLVILNEDESGYVQFFQDALRDLISMGHAREMLNRSGGIFLLQRSLMSEEAIILLQTVARVIFSGDAGSAQVQLRRMAKQLTDDNGEPAGQAVFDKGKIVSLASRKARQDVDCIIVPHLIFANGLGGFTEDGREYIIELRDSWSTPLPWLNVIANPGFGFQVSETGAGFTWSQNSREYKLTPWFNDPITDPVGEALYLRDEQTGELWSPTPAPIREQERYVIRHGQGYTVFEHGSHGLEQELLLFVPLDAPVKIIRLTLRNRTEQALELTASYYAEWVLGSFREPNARYIATEYDDENAILLIRNTYQEEFSGRTAFLAGSGGTVRSYTTDRKEFIGRNGSLADPKGLRKRELAKTTGVGLDPCAVLQVEINLAANEEQTICFFLGDAEGMEAIQAMLRNYQEDEKVLQALEQVHAYWDGLLGQVQVQTPDKSLDILFNRWLLYQTVTCRLWARSAFYQSGGAFGFRDQLQDVMALTVAAPELTRQQIVYQCAHQFVEGDVQHWWHAETGKGIRTRFSDDLLWLPFVVVDYLFHSEDYSILDEEVSFLEGEILEEGTDEKYFVPRVAPEKASVYEHCCRALARGLKFGEHGLPLIGSGDWNDGLNRVGNKGRGESVWLGWFIYLTLQRFAPLVDRRGDQELARSYRATAEELKNKLNRYGWDGGWYRRAYFDDGTPLGSGDNEECQIDAIAQSWAVLSGAAAAPRAEDAMLALEHYLWRRDEGLLLLLTPPFDRADPDPGYIRGYVPGVRENGGQYTHGAIWAVMAYAEMGEGNKAGELFHMLNPINHAQTEHEMFRYKVEPYVMAADVYAKSPHVGRGGWTWYTGAAGWMYQAALEGILGFIRQGEKLTLNPCIPRHWSGYRIEYKYKSTRYVLDVENPQAKMTGVSAVFVDGIKQGSLDLILEDDGGEHDVRIIM